MDIGRSAKEQLVLGPHETVMYTWDDPAGTRLLWWSVVGNTEKCTKPISLNKVHSNTLVSIKLTIHQLISLLTER